MVSPREGRAVRPAIDDNGRVLGTPATDHRLEMTTRRKDEPPPTVGDRLVTALMGFLAAFLTMSLVWLVALRSIDAGPDAPLSFHWTWIVGLLAGAAGFVAGPERMMDAFGMVWRVIGAVVFR